MFLTHCQITHKFYVISEITIQVYNQECALGEETGLFESKGKIT